MPDYHITKDGQQSGPFTKEELSSGLQTGRFLPSDLVWQAGTPDWVPLSTIFPPPPPASAPFLPQPLPPNQLLTAPQPKEKIGCLQIIGLGFLAFIALVIVGGILSDSDGGSDNSQAAAPLTEEEKAKETFRKANNGNAIIANASEGTTFQKEQYEQRHLGKRYFFKGNVDDVKSEHVISVMLDAGNHANVTFETDDVSSFKEGKVVQFTAVIEAFGTGILINHDLGEAKLEGL